MLTVISLGAGVQSSVMALMAAHGEIEPMPDCAIFADTQAEPQHVYDWLDWLETQLPFPVHRVTHGSLKEAVSSGKDGPRLATPPFFTGAKGGSQTGILRRQCTQEYKIKPIQKKLREMAGIKPRQRVKEVRVSQWIGISLDEIQRMKDPPEKWCENRWPLLEKRMTRLHCLEWMRDKGYNQLPRKSACTFCPYHDNETWRQMKREDPDSFAEAVMVDEAIRDGFQKTTQKLYVHRSCIPLKDVDFRNAEDYGQLSFLDECDGMCGV